MKRVNEIDTMKPEYTLEDLGVGVRGKYHTSKNEKCVVVVLDPKVAEAFPNAKAVNSALLSLIKIAQKTASKKS